MWFGISTLSTCVLSRGHQVANLVRISEPFSPASCAECSACCSRAKVQVLLHANADYVVVTWDLTVV